MENSFNEPELPFCDSDEENEVFFGPVSDKEKRKCNKYKRQTAVFTDGFRDDKNLMRYTIDPNLTSVDDTSKCRTSEISSTLNRKMSILTTVAECETSENVTVKQGVTDPNIVLPHELAVLRDVTNEGTSQVSPKQSGHSNPKSTENGDFSQQMPTDSSKGGCIMESTKLLDVEGDVICLTNDKRDANETTSSDILQHSPVSDNKMVEVPISECEAVELSTSDDKITDVLPVSNLKIGVTGFDDSSEKVCIPSDKDIEVIVNSKYNNTPLNIAASNENIDASELIDNVVDKIELKDNHVDVPISHDRTKSEESGRECIDKSVSHGNTASMSVSQGRTIGNCATSSSTEETVDGMSSHGIINNIPPAINVTDEFEDSLESEHLQHNCIPSATEFVNKTNTEIVENPNDVLSSKDFQLLNTSAHADVVNVINVINDSLESGPCISHLARNSLLDASLSTAKESLDSGIGDCELKSTIKHDQNMQVELANNISLIVETESSDILQSTTDMSQANGNNVASNEVQTTMKQVEEVVIINQSRCTDALESPGSCKNSDDICTESVENGNRSLELSLQELTLSAEPLPTQDSVPSPMKQIYEDDATVQQTCDDSRNDNEVTFKSCPNDTHHSGDTDDENNFHVQRIPVSPQDSGINSNYIEDDNEISFKVPLNEKPLQQTPDELLTLESLSSAPHLTPSRLTVTKSTSLLDTPDRSLSASPALVMTPPIVFKQDFSPTLYVKDVKVPSPAPAMDDYIPSAANVTTKRLHTPKLNDTTVARNLGLDITFSEFSSMPSSIRKKLSRSVVHSPAVVQCAEEAVASGYASPMEVNDLDVAFVDPGTPDGMSPMKPRRDGDRFVTPKRPTAGELLPHYTPNSANKLHYESVLSPFDEILAKEKQQLNQLRESKQRLQARIEDLSTSPSVKSPRAYRSHSHKKRLQNPDLKHITLKGKELHAVTKVHTMCNSHRSVQIIRKATTPDIIKHTPVLRKVANKLQWDEDLERDQIQIKRHSPKKMTPRRPSILNQRDDNLLFPFSDRSPSPVVLQKSKGHASASARRTLRSPPPIPRSNEKPAWDE